MTQLKKHIMRTHLFVAPLLFPMAAWSATLTVGPTEQYQTVSAAVAASQNGDIIVRIKTKATAGKDDPGMPMASPYIAIINSQAKIILRAASELGFTPVSRPRVSAGAATPPGGGFLAEAEAAPRGGRQALSLDEFLATAPPRSKPN